MMYVMYSDLTYSRQLKNSLTAGPKYDIVLSSGFLAFASHSGFLKAVEEVNISTFPL